MLPKVCGRNWPPRAGRGYLVSRAALFVRWVLGVSVAVFLALGLAFMFVPDIMMIDAIDLKAEPPKALADVRAVYGGLRLAVAILLAICFFRKHWANGLAISALVWTCLFSGRLVGIVVDPERDILTYGLFASAVLGAALSAVAWFLARRPESAAPAAVFTPAPAATPVETATTNQEG